MSFDGTLIFGTGIDNSGFEKGLSTLNQIGSTALGMLAADIAKQIGSIAAQIPAQMLNVGSGFEASMSQVAATMGITSATAEFQTLSDAAKEMGESTKFSASQAGEALNYLALAGYDANKAVAALPTVLNVAAAGGMELAAASDMVTDAMSALGLETSQMADFSDKLAVTAQKSNTSVSQLGEAILTVGGTAKMLSGGVTEMNTALGILADNGIKGSEGGTALRNVILSLSAPTDTATAALESLGVTAFDASGAMRPLEDTFADLNTALSTLSDQERTAVLNEIFNKVDLKSVNALLGTSSERFDELGGYISDCAGAAAQMAQTMDDNLKGDFTIMQSALEGLGIAAYEKFQTPMRSAVQEVTVSIGELTESLTDGELSGAFDKVANGMSEIAGSTLRLAAEDVLPAAINAFAWITDNFDTVAAVTGAAAAAVVTYKVATEGAIIAQNSFNAVASLNVYALIAAGAMAAASALAIYVSNMDTSAPMQEFVANTNAETYALQKQREEFENLKKSQAEKNAADNAEINNIQKLWNELRGYVDETGNVISENERANEIIGLLNENYSMNIDYINGQIQGYEALSGSMENYIDNLRLEAQIRNAQPAYDETIQNIDNVIAKKEELEQQLRNEIEEFKKSQDHGGGGGSFDNDDFTSYNREAIAERINSIKLEIEELNKLQSGYEAAAEEFENLVGKKFSTEIEITGTNPFSDFVSGQISSASKLYADGMQTVASVQEAATAALIDGWKQLEHKYATGVIATEAELWSQKSALLEQYGNADLEDHWKYYEELYDYQQNYVENSLRLSEEAAEEQRKARESEWNNISRIQSMGLISAEDAYKMQLAYIQKYCPEYSDEWYDYYKTIIDYQHEAQKEQINGIRDSLSETVNEYRTAFSELESSVDSYKNRLLSVGDFISIDSGTDENGVETTTYSVENLQKQMDKMQKYHDYIKQLKDRGASQEILSELTSYDFDDGSFIAENFAKMSDAEFKKINKLYSEREKLASDLANELYAPEMEELNTELVNTVIAEFETLPNKIHIIGSEALDSFIDGLSETENLSEKISDFTDSFFDACNNGILFGSADLNFTDSIINALSEQDIYAIGKEKGGELASGFNDALNDLYMKFTAQLNENILSEFQEIAASEQLYMANMHGSQYKLQTQNSHTPSAENIVLKNHVDTTVKVDGDTIGKVAYEYIQLHNFRTGE